MNRDRVRRWLVEWVATNHGLEPSEVSSDRPLEEYGLSSRDAVALAADLGDELGDEFPPTLLWEQPTIDDLARLAAGEGMRHQPSSPRPSPVTEPVAVIGVGCRFPGASGPEQFWRMLLAGHDAVSPAPPGRGDADVPRWGGFLQDVAGFDAAFFGVAPREAELMDPQQRLLLEVTHEALVHAGIAPRSLRGSATGVFTGISTHDYAQLTLAEPGEVDMWTATGAAGSVAANRLSYVYDLRGPSMAVDTACSSSLVAAHHAVTALRAGEADLALAGGANVMLVPGPTLAFARGGVLARDGRCKPFDAAADGISRGEGCGVVVLKRLADAERDGDRVLAVIRATTVNSGGRSNGLTAPNPAAQEALLARAYESAAVDPATVDYVETHGTGTFLGDPIEAGALGAVLGAGRQPDVPLLLGSVKANIAHTEAAAGIAGLIKVVLAMEHDLIPPTPHFTTPNPHIPFERARLRVVTEPTPWPRYGDTARAGVSAFGFGGTNAHLVLEAPHRAAAPPSRPGPHIAILSAPSPERLRDTASRLADWFVTPANRDLRLADRLADVAYTLARRDNGDRYRSAIVATDLVGLASRLRVPAIDVPVVGEADDNGPVFVFSGYGSQWPGMAAALLATEPAFAAAVDELDASFVRHASFSLREALGASQEITALDRVQMTIFGIQVALAAQWRALGVRPSAVVGHSMGEVAAAVVAGALSVDDGVRVMTVRSTLLRRVHERGSGAMAAVELSEEELDRLRGRFPRVAVAVHASPEQLTVAGDSDEIDRLVAHVEGMGRVARVLPVGGAGHTDAVLPVADQLRAQLDGVRGVPPTVPLYGTVLTDPRSTPAFDPAYWVEHTRRPVRFAQAVTAAIADGHRCFLEVSPHPIAAAAVVRTAATAGVDVVVAASLRRHQDEAGTLLTSLAELYRAGVPVDWQARYPTGRLVDLPGMPWRHHHYWINGGTCRQGASAPRPVGDAPDVPPRPARERLIELVSTIMGFAPGELDPERPLVDLGLDSLMATRIRNVVRQEFGVVPDQSTVLSGASIADIAKLFDQEPSPVQWLKHGTSQPPLFLFHPGGGSCDVYRELVSRLPDPVPCVGFNRVAGGSIEDRVDRYVTLIRHIQPRGPYRLAGWSFGGALAHALARRLAGSAEDVTLVAMLDTVLPLPSDAGPRQSWAERLRRFTGYLRRTYGTSVLVSRDELTALSEEEQIDLVATRVEQAGIMSRGVLRHQRESFLDTLAAERTVPRPYHGPVVLYRATQPYADGVALEPRYQRTDPTAGWDELCPALDVVTVPADHLSIIDPPHIDVVAHHLSAQLTLREAA